LLGSLGLASCGSTTATAPTLERLTFEATTATYLRLEDESRPVFLLRPGQETTREVALEPGSRLVLALAVLEAAPARGFLHLDVSVDGTPAFRDRFSVRRKQHWWHRSVTLPGSGRVRLSLRLTHGRASGAPLEVSERDLGPWIALAVPRLYRPPRSDSRRRVLVWISQDALRADHLGAYGHSRASSPEFDERARGWALFENAVASSSWTLPSMASQFTSRHPAYHGAVVHDLLRDDSVPTLFEALAAEGFTVLGVTANDLISPSHDLASGFDALWYREGRAALLNERVLASLGEWHGGDLALFVHYMDPHATYFPPAPFDRLFDPQYAGPVEGRNTHFQTLLKISDPRDVEHVRALYDGEIAYADREIGSLLAELGARGLTQSAVIAYTSDHGEEFRDHGSWHHGGTLYQELVHVPLALRVPGLPGARLEQTVSLVDLAPTILDAFQIPIPGSFQGRSLLPLLDGETLEEASVVSETHLTAAHKRLISIRKGQLKYILAVAPGQGTPTILAEELYDLAVDPGEKVNRVSSPQADPLRQEALAYLIRAGAEARPPRKAELDAASMEKLRALGYIQ
jgi:arylsulfatase A-like enzyme